MTGSNTREPWPDFWMREADLIGSRSKCDLRKVGAIAVATDGRRMVGSGYNGPPAGYPEEPGQTCRDFCPRAQPGAERGTSYSNDVAVHAEMNLLTTYSREQLAGATLYVSSACCWDCSKVIANSGIAAVVMRVSERDAHREPEKSIELLRKCGVEVTVVHD